MKSGYPIVIIWTVNLLFGVGLFNSYYLVNKKPLSPREIYAKLTTKITFSTCPENEQIHNFLESCTYFLSHMFANIDSKKPLRFYVLDRFIWKLDRLAKGSYNAKEALVFFIQYSTGQIFSDKDFATCTISKDDKAIPAILDAFNVPNKLDESKYTFTDFVVDIGLHSMQVLEIENENKKYEWQDLCTMVRDSDAKLNLQSITVNLRNTDSIESFLNKVVQNKNAKLMDPNIGLVAIPNWAQYWGEQKNNFNFHSVLLGYQMALYANRIDNHYLRKY